MTVLPLTSGLIWKRFRHKRRTDRLLNGWTDELKQKKEDVSEDRSLDRSEGINVHSEIKKKRVHETHAYLFVDRVCSQFRLSLSRLLALSLSLSLARARARHPSPLLLVSPFFPLPLSRQVFGLSSLALQLVRFAALFPRPMLDFSEADSYLQHNSDK